MIFWITVALTIAAMIVAGVVASKKAKRSYYNDGEDVAIAIFVTWIIAFVISWIILGIAGAGHAAQSKAEFQQVGKWDYRIADGTTPEIDREDGEFEFYTKQNGVLQEMEIYGTNVTYATGGDRKSVTVLDQRAQHGTAVFPWGQSTDIRTITVK